MENSLQIYTVKLYTSFVKEIVKNHQGEFYYYFISSELNSKQNFDLRKVIRQKN